MEQLSETRAPPDELLRTLADGRRRRILDHLSETSERQERLPKVAAAVADGPGASEAANVPDLEISLHHAHLPALDRVGLVAYDPEDRTVSYTASDEAERLLTFVDEHLE